MTNTSNSTVVESEVAKLRAARQRQKRQTGRCEGRKRFGEHPGEVDTLARMKALAAAGRTSYAVAQNLNNEGLPSRSGRPWTTTSVRRILAR